VFIHYLTNVAVKLRVRMYDASYVPVTGIAQGSATVTIIKPDGTTQLLTAAAGTNGFTWAEVTTGAFSGKGVYLVTITADVVAVAGEYTAACSGGTGGAVAEFCAWANVPSDVYARLGAPVGASMSADLALVSAAAVLARKMATNKAIENNNQYTVYDDDGTTVLKLFNTYDQAGAPTTTAVFRRTPV
jgi:hypothetical protein